jgi:Cadherin cytoplasmic region/Laminin G domain
MSNVSILHLVIGDINDNAMKEGSSNIFVYNYKGEAPDVEIGRVYVDDPDDWDLPDKSFNWKDGVSHPNFALNKDNGMITMVYGTSDGEYHLHFTVVEQSRLIDRHQVDAHVNITVREIPEEAVVQSGSVRLYGITAEEFIDEKHGELSPKEKFRYSMAQLLNVSADNLDVFTVLKSDNDSLILDVRFSAHGSPYYAPERLNGMVAQNQAKLEEELGFKMLMINIDECIIERYKCESSCSNVLHTSNVPLAVYTNTTSFVGVNAFIQAECVCHAKVPLKCLNGGTAFDNFCECQDGFEGPFCESIAIGFYGNGWAMYPPVNPCDTTKISLELTPQREDGLVMYIGPMSYNPLLPVQDFLALELVKGYPTLTVDYGTGAIRIEHKHIHFGPGKSYIVDILLQKTSIEMTVDSCKLSTCMSLGAPQGPNEFLNVNAPLQLGGASVNLEYLASMYNWSHVPQNLGYSGCIKNLTVDDKTYNIGAPSMFKNIDPGCQRSIAVAVSFGIDRNFLIALLCCIALLIILLLAVVVHRRHQDGWHEKDMDDIRETIINYEDEGGGERDTDYDLNVLRAPPIYEDKPYKTDMRQKEANEVPDIGAFLTDKKDACDKDTDAYPIDDVRHYAYEGDGNSTGSLSSLASCTDDGDLKFNYLSNFGPRFRKLADMYGEEPSDTDSNVDGDEGWRI